MSARVQRTWVRICVRTCVCDYEFEETINLRTFVVCMRAPEHACTQLHVYACIYQYAQQICRTNKITN